MGSSMRKSKPILLKFWSYIQTHVSLPLQYGIAVLLALLLYFGFSSFGAIVDRYDSKSERLESELLLLESLEPLPVWQERLSFAEALQISRDTQYWTGSSGGLVGAKLNQTLRKIYDPFHIRIPKSQQNFNLTRIDVNPDVELFDDKTEILRFSTSVRLLESDVDDLVFELASVSPDIFVDSFRATFPERDTQLATVSWEGFVKFRRVAPDQ